MLVFDRSRDDSSPLLDVATSPLLHCPLRFACIKLAKTFITARPQSLFLQDALLAAKGDDLRFVLICASTYADRVIVFVVHLRVRLGTVFLDYFK